jgi:hypothetical protein
MSNNKSLKVPADNKAPALIPFQVKSRPEIRQRIVTLAERRGLSANDVASLALAAGIDRVEKSLNLLTQPEAEKAAA